MAATGTLRTRLAKLEVAGRPAPGFGDRLDAALKRPRRSVEEHRADVLALPASPLRARLLRAWERLDA